VKYVLLFYMFVAVSLGLWGGWFGAKPPADGASLALGPVTVTGVRLEPGAPIRVVLGSRVSARTARPGDVWEDWMMEDAVVSRAGTQRSGFGAKPWVGQTAGADMVLDEVRAPAGASQATFPATFYDQALPAGVGLR